MSKSYIRFFVGEYTGKRSSVWKITASKNEVYLTSRSFGRSYKISFHESGQCQCSITSEFWKKLNRPNKERHLDKWILPEIAPNTCKPFFKILFPYRELVEFGHDDLGDNGFSIKPPRENEYLELVIYRTSETDLETFEHTLETIYEKLIVAFTLPNRSGYIICYRCAQIDENIINMLTEFRTVAEAKKKELGINDRMCAHWGIKSDNEIRTMCQLYV